MKPAATTIILLMCGCAVGPTFRKPAAPEGAAYTSDSLLPTSSTPSVAGGEAQRFVAGLDIPGEWWTLFHSPQLNDLVEQSLKHNPDIGAAEGALLAAREHFLAQHGAFLPSVAGSFSATRQKTPESLSPTPSSGSVYYSLYTPQVSVSFVPDVFGLTRRTVEAARAQMEGERFALAATHITLSSNVVVAAIQEAALREQIDATRHLIAADSAIVGVLATQYAAGYASRLDLAAQESQLASVMATLPPLLKQLAQQRDLLARLSGSFPNQAQPEEFTLSSLDLPQELPVSIPSQLVEQRPDVRQAEENLHAASAQIGIAIANRLPSFPLTATAGSASLTLAKIFGAGTGFWALGAAVTQPIFQGGALRHQERAARAAYLQAAEQYRGTVLTAFQNVADVLNALEQDAAGLKAAAVAEQAARITLDLVQQQMQRGYVGYLTLLNAESAYQQALINLGQARANRLTDTAALFQALGGGWWKRSDLPQDQP